MGSNRTGSTHRPLDGEEPNNHVSAMREGTPAYRLAAVTWIAIIIGGLGLLWFASTWFAPSIGWLFDLTWITALAFVIWRTGGWRLIFGEGRWRTALLFLPLIAFAIGISIVEGNIDREPTELLAE